MLGGKACCKSSHEMKDRTTAATAPRQVTSKSGRQRAAAKMRLTNFSNATPTLVSMFSVWCDQECGTKRRSPAFCTSSSGLCGLPPVEHAVLFRRYTNSVAVLYKFRPFGSSHQRFFPYALSVAETGKFRPGENRPAERVAALTVHSQLNDASGTVSRCHFRRGRAGALQYQLTCR